MEQLPPHTRYATERVLEQLGVVESQIGLFEQRTREVFSKTAELEVVMSLPGVGFILGVVIVLEVGDVSRFPTASHLASYAGTTPRVHSSGGKTRYGQLREDVNRYLKWAYVEAANAVCLQRRFFPHRHVSQLYDRIARRKGHQKAIGAVARHLAEATYWMLRRRQSYQEPKRTVPVSSTEA
jgi:transposase